MRADLTEDQRLAIANITDRHDMTGRFPYEYGFYQIDERHQFIHRIDLRNSWYRGMGSTEGLISRLTSRYHRVTVELGRKGFYPNLMRYDELSWFMKRDPLPTLVEHESPEAFFAYIGYTKGSNRACDLDRLLEKGWRSDGPS